MKQIRQEIKADKKGGQGDFFHTMIFTKKDKKEELYIGRQMTYPPTPEPGQFKMSCHFGHGKHCRSILILSKTPADFKIPPPQNTESQEPKDMQNQASMVTVSQTPQKAWRKDDSDAFEFEDGGEKGVPVRALYDYKAAQEDELTFKSGEIIEKLGNADEDGWCRGRKDGKVGLYPSNFVESVLMNEVTLNNVTISHSHV